MFPLSMWCASRDFAHIALLLIAPVSKLVAGPLAHVPHMAGGPEDWHEEKGDTLHPRRSGYDVSRDWDGYFERRGVKDLKSVPNIAARLVNLLQTGVGMSHFHMPVLCSPVVFTCMCFSHLSRFHMHVLC
jgi:hypothetical protein